MKKKNRVISAFVIGAMLLTMLPMKKAEAYYEVIAQCDFEEYEENYLPSNNGFWRNNTGRPMAVTIEDSGNKALKYKGYGSYAQFGMTEPATGRFLVSMDMLLPENFTDFRVYLSNSNYSAIAFFYFRNDATVRLVQGTTGKDQYLTVASGVPKGEWFNFKVLVDTDLQEIRVLINDTDSGEAYPFQHKYAGSNATEEEKEANLFRLMFADRNKDDYEFLIDNISISFVKEVIAPSPITEIVDVGDSEYKLPYEIEVNVDDGTKEKMKVISAVPLGAELDINSVGLYEYEIKIENYEGVISYTIDVRNREIADIDEIFEEIIVNEDYKLPQYVSAHMNDGTEKRFPVIWESSNFDPEFPGVYEIFGSVEGYDNPVKITVMITPKSVLSADTAYLSVNVGESISLPEKTPVKFTDNTWGNAPVSWESISHIDANVKGKYTIYGNIDGLEEKVKMIITVYERDNDDQNRFDAAQEFIDNILLYGRDMSSYGQSLNVFAANAMDIPNNTFMKWRFPTGEEVPLCSFASQGVFMRSLVNLSTLTADESYKNEAERMMQYYFDNYVADNGLLQWGGHASLNLSDYTVIGEQGTEENLIYHELKDHYPMYDMMFELDREKTDKYIKSIWLGHFHTWDDFYFNRHASYKKEITDADIENAWNQNSSGDWRNWQYPQLPVDSNQALPFINAANDYMYAASYLAARGDEAAEEWLIRLENMYLKSRNPETGLMPMVYSIPTEDYMTVDHYSCDFEISTESQNYPNTRLGDRVQNSFPHLADNPYCRDYSSTITVSYADPVYQVNPLVMLKCAENLSGENAQYLIDSANEILEAFIKYAYVPQYNKFHSILNDGTPVTGYLPRRYFTFATYGQTVELNALDATYALTAARVYNAKKSNIVWEFLRNVCDANCLGDIGTAPGENMELNYSTETSEPKVLLALIELYKETQVDEYLKMAEILGNNILNNNLVNGYFVKEKNNRYSETNNVYAYALLALDAAVRGRFDIEFEYYTDDPLVQMYYQDDTGYVSRRMGSSVLKETYASESSMITSFEITNEEVKLKVGESERINVVIEPANASEKTVIFESDNRNVAIVDENGNVTALGEGTAVITAEAEIGPFRESITIEVTAQ